MSSALAALVDVGLGPAPKRAPARAGRRRASPGAARACARDRARGSCSPTSPRRSSTAADAAIVVGLLRSLRGRAARPAWSPPRRPSSRARSTVACSSSRLAGSAPRPILFSYLLGATFRACRRGGARARRQRCCSRARRSSWPGGTLGRRSRARPCPRRHGARDLRRRGRAPGRGHAAGGAGRDRRARSRPAGSGGGPRTSRPPSRWPSSGGSSARAATGSIACRRTRCPPGSRSRRRRRSAPSELEALVETARSAAGGDARCRRHSAGSSPLERFRRGLRPGRLRPWRPSSGSPRSACRCRGHGRRAAGRRGGSGHPPSRRGARALRLAAPPVLQAVVPRRPLGSLLGLGLLLLASEPGAPVDGRLAPRGPGPRPPPAPPIPLAGDPDRRRRGARAGGRPRRRPRLTRAAVSGPVVAPLPRLPLGLLARRPRGRPAGRARAPGRRRPAGART